MKWWKTNKCIIFLISKCGREKQMIGGGVDRYGKAQGGFRLRVNLNTHIFLFKFHESDYETT